MDNEKIKYLEQAFGIEIKDTTLFKTALTHSSFSKENDTPENYERLEFLGDAVLKLSVSEILYKKYPQYSEGNLSKIRSIVVSDETLSKIVDKFELKQCLILGKQEEKLGGRNKQSIKACMFEAILGAYYLSGFFSEVEEFLKNILVDFIEEVDRNFVKYNSKEVLQEYTQKQSKNTPEYKLVKEEGPAHNKIFTVEVIYNEKILATGCGKTKREAEKQAAYIACQNLEITRESLK
jgi:ribonuclease-3